jgi:hypothetical protein
MNEMDFICRSKVYVGLTVDKQILGSPQELLANSIAFAAASLKSSNAYNGKPLSEIWRLS